jgi:5-methylcytosine-specific restriction endonuclease McrA
MNRVERGRYLFQKIFTTEQYRQIKKQAQQRALEQKLNPVALLPLTQKINDGLPRCNNPYCKLNFPENFYHIDHVFPKAKGGLDIPENQQLLCADCNRRKHTTVWEVFLIQESKYRKVKDLFT